MRTIHLHGSLGQAFGTSFRLDVADIAEALQALQANFANFFSFLKNGHYRVVVGKTERNGLELDEAMLPGFKLGKQDLHIVPVIAGAKRGGIGKIIAGIALVGLAAVTGGTALMSATLWGTTTMAGIVGNIGMGMVLTGVASLIAPQQDGDEDKQSYTMSGPQVTTREGGIVPIAYGEVITGATMISGALNIKHKDE